MDQRQDEQPGDSREAAAKLGELLRARGEKITFAESCTAGLLSATFCAEPGASEVYDGGLVSYANAVKTMFLGVPTEILERDGAVSARCAEEMARGAAALFEADLALSVTGVAGPGGGSEEKPVGTVYIAGWYKGKISVEKHLFSGERNEVRAQSVYAALQLGRRLI